MKPEMKLTDILVEWLPSRGGWPEGAECCHLTQYDRHCLTIGFYHSNASAENNAIISKTEMVFSGIGCLGNTLHDCTVTAEQYEAALAAKNEGWIEWGGGECPVPRGTLVDVRYRNGKENYHIGAGIYLDDTGSNPDHNAEDWNNDDSPLDIIAYRLHKPQEVEQSEADDEADLNECIGQNAAPVWVGEGLPPVGVECEYSWAGEPWASGVIRYISKHTIIIETQADSTGDTECAYHPTDIKLRPFRTESR